MDKFQVDAILKCFCEPNIRDKLNFKSSFELATQLADSISELPGKIDNGNKDKKINRINDCLNSRRIHRGARNIIAEHLVPIASANVDIILESREIDTLTKERVRELLLLPPSEVDNHFEKLLDKKVGFLFKPRSPTGKHLLISGVYQLYRRYKPHVEQSTNDEPENPQNHVVICEVVYINTRTMTCVLLTSGKDIYRGTMSANQKNVLSIILHRSSSTGDNYRFISAPLVDATLHVYSGIMIKTGDTLKRPLASELLIKRVSRKDHYDLYRSMKTFFDGNKPSDADERIAYQYISNPPPVDRRNKKGWNGVKFVHDFELISELSKTINGVTMFRDPSRTLHFNDLIKASDKYDLPLHKNPE